MLAVLLSTLGVAEPPPLGTTFPKGQLVQSVESSSGRGLHHAVYVPTSYDPSRPAPVLFLMDPRSRAHVPAEVFRPAAERYGYILISSHDTTTDGPVEPNLRAIQAMWADVHAWFAVDDRRTYLVGFSGTARLSTLLAHHLSGSFAGVIGVGAGFHPEYPPSKNTRFLYFGATGDVDYNFHEIETLEDDLAALNLPHRLARFPGPHSWLPPELASDAVEWLELRAMQRGSRARDEALLDAWYARDRETAEALATAGRLVDASRLQSAIARDYAGLRDVTGPSAEAARLLASPAGEREFKARRQTTAAFHRWMAHAMHTIVEAFLTDISEPSQPAAEIAAELEIGKLRRQAAGTDPALAIEARRRLNSLDVQLGFYLPNDALRRGDIERAAYYLGLALQVDDESPVTWYMAAGTHARLRQPREALTALRRAADAGFRDLASLEADPVFARLREAPEYQDVVRELSEHGDTAVVLGVDRPPVLRLR